MSFGVPRWRFMLAGIYAAVQESRLAIPLFRTTLEQGDRVALWLELEDPSDIRILISALRNTRHGSRLDVSVDRAVIATTAGNGAMKRRMLRSGLILAIAILAISVGCEPAPRTSADRWTSAAIGAGLRRGVSPDLYFRALPDSVSGGDGLSGWYSTPQPAVRVHRATFPDGSIVESIWTTNIFTEPAQVTLTTFVALPARGPVSD